MKSWHCCAEEKRVPSDYHVIAQVSWSPHTCGDADMCGEVWRSVTPVSGFRILHWKFRMVWKLQSGAPLHSTYAYHTRIPASRYRKAHNQGILPIPLKPFGEARFQIDVSNFKQGFRFPESGAIREPICGQHYTYAYYSSSRLMAGGVQNTLASERRQISPNAERGELMGGSPQPSLAPC